MKYKIYFDLDGVLADFDAGVLELTGVDLSLSNGDGLKGTGYYETIFNSDDFFLNLRVIPGAKDMVEYAKTLGKVEILSATGFSNIESVTRQKEQWVAMHLPGVPITCVERSHEKAKYAGPNIFLIDDRLEKCVEPFIAAGGFGIHHTGNYSTLRKLERKMVENDIQKQCSFLD